MPGTSDNEPSTFLTRVLSESDIEGALRLCRESGWNQVREDWQRLLRYEPSGCFAAICQDRLTATVTTTRFGDELAWIGMMLVDSEFRRRGMATALMRLSLEYLTGHQVRCIKLDATPAGKHVYDRLGFQSEWTFHRWRRSASNAAAPTDTAVACDALPESLLDLDREAFGADRSGILNLLGDASFVRVVRGGFGVLRPGFVASYIGPVVAEAPDVAESIVRALCERTVDDIFWDIPGPNVDGIRIARSMGFEPVRELTRMWLGDECSRPNLKLQYALADLSKG